MLCSAALILKLWSFCWTVVIFKTHNTKILQDFNIITTTLKLKCNVKPVLVSACSQSCVLRALTVRHLVLIYSRSETLMTS